jgi:hypothetical protein
LQHGQHAPGMLQVNGPTAAGCILHSLSAPNLQPCQTGTVTPSIAQTTTPRFVSAVEH